ncbi:MAG: MlaD family protein [Bacteroidales bacterium]|nr:MlaD family protein [Bacteroidales bacterium]
MIFKNKSIWIGISFVVAFFLLYWGINFLKGKNVFTEKITLYAEYNNIAGLSVANPVILKGYKVGQVDKIEFKENNPEIIVVRFVITKQVNIPKNSIARITSYDLLGSKAIEIIPGNSPSVVSSGDFLIGEIAMDLKQEVSMQILPLKYKAEELLSSFDSVLTALRLIFNEQSQQNIRSSLESIRKTLSSIEHSSYTLDTLLTTEKNRLKMILYNVESITQNLKNNNELITQIFRNLHQITDSLTRVKFVETISNANQTIYQFNEIAYKINSGNGSIALLLNNDSLYRNLQKSLEDLDLLIQDLRLNPHRYVHFSLIGPIQKQNKYKPRTSVR